MKLTVQDWRRLRYPLIGLGLALILAIALASYAEQRRVAAGQDLSRRQSQLQQARQRYESSGLEKQTIMQYLPQYQRLIAQGFIGEERRLEWVDGLRTIQQQYKLFNINYSVAAQEEYKPAFSLNTGSFKLFRSVMKLELFMLHEGDLLTMMDALRQNENGLFMLRQCEITRLPAASSNALAPSLVAKCELDWLTIHEPQTTANGAS